MLNRRSVLKYGIGLWAHQIASGQASPEPNADLYVVSGTFGYGGNFPVCLYRLSAKEPGAPALVRRIADGMQCVLMDHERRRLVIGSPAIAPTVFEIVNMDSPLGRLRGRIPYDSKEFLPGDSIYLLDTPEHGEVVALALHRLGKQPVLVPRNLTALALDAPDSILEIPFDLRSLRVSGYAGGALPGNQDAPQVRGRPLRILVGDGVGRESGLPRPPYWDTDPATESYPLVVCNSTVAVLTAPVGAIDVFRKDTREWRRVFLPFRQSRIRGFGQWIAALALETMQEPGGTSVLERGKSAPQRRISPGASKRRAAKIDGRMTVDDFFEDSMAYFPGDLLVYNVVSGSMHRISTGEGDSEVLLVTDERVFYRINDVLYRRELVGPRIGEPIKMGEHEAFVQAHWAFLSGGHHGR